MLKVLIVISLIALTVNFVHGIMVNLSEEDIQEAIDWGVENRHSYENIASFYRFGKRKAYEEHGFINTKFCSIAYLGYEAGKLYKRPERAEIDKILSNKNFEISIMTYGDNKDFADDYHIVLMQGEKVVQPVSVNVWDFTGLRRKKTSGLTGLVRRISAFLTKLIFPGYRYEASVCAEFPYSQIDPNQKTTIILIKDEGQNRFEVDFSMCK